jgi:hypothetical protein
LPRNPCRRFNFVWRKCDARVELIDMIDAVAARRVIGAGEQVEPVVDTVADLRSHDVRGGIGARVAVRQRDDAEIMAGEQHRTPHPAAAFDP